ncbi:tripartite tricarboxylate transporter permease [Chloroflexota bacterium]
MIIDAFTTALASFTDLSFLLWMMAGTIVGLVFGIIPGIGSMTALALFLPFTFVLPPEQALPFMMATMSMSNNGGTITAILVGVPGVPGNAATMLDGFQMTRRGEGGRALGAALTSSAAGGVLSVIMALGMVVLVLPMIMAITNADMVFIILVGLAFIATLSRGSLNKGLISAGLGLLISLVGYQSVSGLYRFTFGAIYLFDGVPMIPVALGLFGLPVMIDLATKGGTIAEAGAVTTRISDVWRGAKDVFHHRWLWLRSTVIGYIIGVLPGIGGEAAIWICYAQAKQSSKYPEKFGTGVVEGVIAPESAGNGREGGGALTTFALGIPGTAVMALILAGLMMAGLRPGPSMLTEHLSLSFSLLLVIAVANVIGTLMALPAASYMAKVAYIPGRILAPLVLAILVVGTFAYQQRLTDLFTLLAFGGLGWALVKLRYNTAALFIGFVLGSLFEYYLFMSLKVAGPLFFIRPISLVLIVVFIAILFYGPISRVVKRRFNMRS